MQSACLAPSSFSSVPTNSPARVSGSPKKDSAPYFCQSRSPALMATTGMPASTAFCTTGPSAAGSGSVTMMPSTLLSMAFWINVACSGTWPDPAYRNSTLSLSAASWAPLWICDQKASLAAPWVTIAMFSRSPSGAAALLVLRAALAAARGEGEQGHGGEAGPSRFLLGTEHHCSFRWWGVIAAEAGTCVGR